MRRPASRAMRRGAEIVVAESVPLGSCAGTVKLTGVAADC